MTTESFLTSPKRSPMVLILMWPCDAWASSRETAKEGIGESGGTMGTEALGQGQARSYARFAGLFTVAMIVAFALALDAPAADGAEPPSSLWGEPGARVCLAGSAAGQCSIPRGVAANSQNGHVFVADQANKRIVEFNALGQFIKMWGWDVVQSGPGDTGTEFEICKPDVGDVCKAGANGSGAGQFAAPVGMAVDSNGNVFAVDLTNFRVQKFDSQGNFLLMFGGGVNQGGGTPENPGNLCTAEHIVNGDICDKGSEGSGEGEFGGWRPDGSLTLGDFISISPVDDIYVGDNGRIQRFDVSGVLQGEVSLPSRVVVSLDVDLLGNIYYVDRDKLGVHKVSPTGIPLPPEDFELPRETVPTATAVNAVGNVYAFGHIKPESGTGSTPTIVEFDPKGAITAEFGQGEFSASSGLAANLCPDSEAPGNLYVANASSTDPFLRAYGTQPLGCFKARTLPPTSVEETSATLNGTVNPKGEAVTECFFEYGTTTAYGQITQCLPMASEIGTGNAAVPVHANISSLPPTTVHHVRLIAQIGGEVETGADLAFKTKGAPVITEDHVVGVTDDEATLKALVNPEGLPTSYSFEYTTLTSFNAKGFEGAISTPVVAIGADRTEHQAIAKLIGLTPGTAYRWRIVATNTAVLNDGVSTGKTHSLFTRSLAGLDSCPNDAFRRNAAAVLPDCRGYEMVSPIDKNGGDIVKGNVASAGETGGYVKASPDGQRLTYTSLAPFGELESGVNLNQYLSQRVERDEPGEGWSSRGIRPQVAGQEVDEDNDTFNAFRQFAAFTPDLCSGWLIDHQTPSMGSGIDGLPNLYRRDNCGPAEGEIEALTDVKPPDGVGKDYIDKQSVQGNSADGRHAFFVARAKLTDEAESGTIPQIYDRFGGSLHLVSVTPGGLATNGVVGSGWSAGSLEGAVSEDGSRVYWTSDKVYLRLHPEQGKVTGECSEASKACTIAVSGGGGFFWAGSADGSKAIYTQSGDLFEFDLVRHEAEEESSRKLAGEIVGVAGVSDDLSHVYFVSREVLPGAVANNEGDKAVEGAPNLYLGANGAGIFIATLEESDVGDNAGGAVIAYNVASKRGFDRATRVSADGSRIAFNSQASLTGYDNSVDGKPAVEVFTYHAGGGLTCVSCNPTGGRPETTEEMREPYLLPWDEGRATNVPAAAWLPTWEQPTHASSALSADGSRLFFNSFDALLSRDGNGVQDVYEWEMVGSGSCDVDDADYFPQNGGCLYLISTGESPYESEFWEASESGDDVFFTTEESLTGSDPGSIDLYDARVGGGFPEPEEVSICEGEACQNPPPPPADTTPASEAYQGPGNVGPKPKARCPKNKRRVRKAGKARCVKKTQGGKHRRRASKGQGVAR